MTYNIPNNKTKLKFTGATIAGIFLGDISKWNDPKLVADNPDLAQVNPRTSSSSTARTDRAPRLASPTI